MARREGRGPAVAQPAVSRQSAQHTAGKAGGLQRCRGLGRPTDAHARKGLTWHVLPQCGPAARAAHGKPTSAAFLRGVLRPHRGCGGADGAYQPPEPPPSARAGAVRSGRPRTEPLPGPRSPRLRSPYSPLRPGNGAAACGRTQAQSLRRVWEKAPARDERPSQARFTGSASRPGARRAPEPRVLAGGRWARSGGRGAARVGVGRRGRAGPGLGSRKPL